MYESMSSSGERPDCSNRICVLYKLSVQERNLNVRFHTVEVINYNCGVILHTARDLRNICQSYGDDA